MNSYIRNALLTVSAFTTFTMTETVELNCFFDDNMQLFINETEITMPKIGGNSWLKDRFDTKRSFDLPRGSVTIAAKVENLAFGGGIALSIELPGGQIVKTDKTWKMSFLPQTTTDWNKKSFNDSQWHNADVLSSVDSMGAVYRYRDHFAKLWEHGAKLIWTPNTLYFRHEFDQVSAQNATMYFHGMMLSHTIYLNGQIVNKGNQYAYSDTWISGEPFWEPTLNLPVQIKAGKNVIAMEITQHPYINNTQAFARLVIPGILRSEKTWKVSDVAPSGWLDAGFDDSSWPNPGAVTSWSPELAQMYFPLAAEGEQMWPTAVYFRKTFSW